MKTLVFKTYSDFLNREDLETNGVSEKFLKLYPDFEKQNETNKGCWNCSDCIYHASSPIKVSPVRFYEENKQAMDDIKLCAEEEKKSQTVTQ